MQAQSKNNSSGRNNDEEEGSLNFSIGGGLTIPVNPTARFTGVGASFVGNGGLNIDRHSTILGEFTWNGLRPSDGAIAQLNGLSADSNLFGITAEYKYHNQVGKTFGYYAIGGGGWYYRHSSFSQSTFVPTSTVCQPIWFWYGFACSSGFVDTVGVTTGTSSFGANAGLGLTIKVKTTPLKFFVESRFVYAASRTISTRIIPVTFGFEYH
jgi:hypothetical protein